MEKSRSRKRPNLLTLNKEFTVHKQVDGLLIMEVHRSQKVKGNNLILPIRSIVTVTCSTIGYKYGDVHSADDYQVIIYLSNQTYLRFLFTKKHNGTSGSMNAHTFKLNIMRKLQENGR
ncbi:MAG: hypothetical protein GYA55_05105 [SAR324 cluster bacterium]|uniref:Uncharacterized protein n=1 Tax=SAR324 cluster bacterium TaxID=2024889 RepID=A0A7X9FRL3_9DELT|nr:hypothetical protein [SAR324 cluster bacterium]